MVNTVKKSRGVLSPQQTQQLIESIQKIQMGTSGLNKKTVVERAFNDTFGPNDASWPIKPHSSTIARYWRFAFPSKKAIRLGKSKSPQALLEDLRRSAPERPVVTEGYKK